MTVGSLTELGFLLWLPVQEVTGYRRPDHNEYDAVMLDHVGRLLVGVNEVSISGILPDQQSCLSYANR